MVEGLKTNLTIAVFKELRLFRLASANFACRAVSEFYVLLSSECMHMRTHCCAFIYLLPLNMFDSTVMGH